MSEHLICWVFFLFFYSSIKDLSLNYWCKGRYRYINAFAKIISFGLAFFSLRKDTQNKCIDTKYI